jgi:hypothetical protein
VCSMVKFSGNSDFRLALSEKWITSDFSGENDNHITLALQVLYSKEAASTEFTKPVLIPSKDSFRSSTYVVADSKLDLLPCSVHFGWDCD